MEREIVFSTSGENKRILEHSDVSLKDIKKQLFDGLDPKLKDIIDKESFKINMEHYPLGDGVLKGHINRVVGDYEDTHQLYSALLALCLGLYEIYKYEYDE